MEETPHLVAHYMAAGAEKRLDDYHFLRNTYETINGQEIQLNRILRMLGEDDVSLNWRLDLSPIGRARSRSLYEFDRWGNSLTLRGSLAYERLREVEQDNSKHGTQVPPPSLPRRVHELRERRQRLSEQRDYASLSNSGDGGGSSSSRLRALAEFDTGLSEAGTKRQRQAEETRSNVSKNEKNGLTETRREKFKTMFDDENQKYERSKQTEDKSSNRFAKNIRLSEEDSENAATNRTTKSIRFNEEDSEKVATSRSTKNDRSSEEDSKTSVASRSTKNQRSSEEDSEKPATNLSTKNDRFNEEDSEKAPANHSAKKDRFNEEDSEKTVASRSTKDDRSSEEDSEKLATNLSTKNDRSNEEDSEKAPANRSAKKDRFNEEDSEKSATSLSTTNDGSNGADSEKTPANRSAKKDRFNEEDFEKSATSLSTKNDGSNEADSEKAPTSRSTKNDRFNEEDSEKSAASLSTNNDGSNEADSEKAANNRSTRKGLSNEEDSEKAPANRSTRKGRFNEEDSEKAVADPPSTNDRFNREDSEKAAASRSTKNDRSDGDEGEEAAGNRESTSDKIRKSSIEHDHDKSGDIDLLSFTVRCETIPSSNKETDDNDSLARLLCQWASPSSSSAIDYYTIERQVGDEEWSRVGEKIDRLKNKTQLDIPSPNNDDNANENVPSHFRLKAHLQNGQTFSSKPTDGIFLNLSKEKNIITPEIEILSPSSVQLSWENEKNEDENNEEKPNIYDIEKKEAQQPEWEKVIEVPLAQRSARIDSLTDATECEFRLVPSSSEEITKTEDEVEPEVLTVHNINELLSSLHIEPTSPNTVDIDISEEGFEEFDCYQIEYTTTDQPDQWTQMSDITRDDPHLTIDNLKQGSDYKFRFTPILSETTNETNPSQLSLVLDVKMPSRRKGRFAKEEIETTVTPPPQFSIQKLDSTSVLIEAIVPEEEPATFEDEFEVYSKNETIDDDWTKVGTIDKDHLSTTVENLEENTVYAFKIDNVTSPSSDDQSNTIQELKFDTTPVKEYDPSIFLEKIEESLENVVNSVMQAAAGHQTLEESVNKSLNEVIREVFRDETLVPNEQYGFDTLALSNDLQIYCGPKQMMLQELKGNETSDLSKHYGEIIIHNYRTSKHGQSSVIVREENGNTRVGNIDGDIIIRNVVSDVLLSNEETRHKLSMNIVGQAFLKGVQGTLIASKFKGIIVVKNVHKP